MKKTKKIIISAVMVTSLFGITTFAGTKLKSYNTTVPKFNGSGYTGYQTKKDASTEAQLNSTSVGGSYKVDARLKASSGTGSWQRDVDDNSTYYLQNSVQAGSSCRIEFSNDLTTPVNVQVTGKWCSN